MECQRSPLRTANISFRGHMSRRRCTSIRQPGRGQALTRESRSIAPALPQRQQTPSSDPEKEPCLQFLHTYNGNVNNTPSIVIKQGHVHLLYEKGQLQKYQAFGSVRKSDCTLPGICVLMHTLHTHIYIHNRIMSNSSITRLCIWLPTSENLHVQI